MALYLRAHKINGCNLNDKLFFLFYFKALDYSSIFMLVYTLFRYQRFTKSSLKDLAWSEKKSERNTTISVNIALVPLRCCSIARLLCQSNFR